MDNSEKCMIDEKHVANAESYSKKTLVSRPLVTKRKKARYGDLVLVAGRPLMVIKSGSKEDFITPQELLEDLFDKPIEAIVFADGEILKEN